MRRRFKSVENLDGSIAADADTDEVVFTLWKMYKPSGKPVPWCG